MTRTGLGVLFIAVGIVMVGSFAVLIETDPRELYISLVAIGVVLGIVGGLMIAGRPRYR